jgi:hypothetical protein
MSSISAGSLCLTAPIAVLRPERALIRRHMRPNWMSGAAAGLDHLGVVVREISPHESADDGGDLVRPFAGNPILAIKGRKHGVLLQ